MVEGRKATWARAWYYTMIRHRGLAIITSDNLIINIGTDPDATHQHDSRYLLRQRATAPLALPLVHPLQMAPDAHYDRLLARYHRGSLRRRLDDGARALARRIT